MQGGSTASSGMDAASQASSVPRARVDMTDGEEPSWRDVGKKVVERAHPAPDPMVKSQAEMTVHATDVATGELVNSKGCEG